MVPICPPNTALESNERPIFNMVSVLPLKSPSIQVRIRHFSYLLIFIDGTDSGIIFNKRGEDDIWKGLYDFPLIEGKKRISIKAIEKHNDCTEWFNKDFNIKASSKLIKHQLSHQTIMVQFYIIKMSSTAAVNLKPSWKLIPFSEVKALPIPRLIENFPKEYYSEF